MELYKNEKTRARREGRKTGVSVVTTWRASQRQEQVEVYLVDRPLTASAAHARAVDAEALLGLVAEPASLVGSCGASHTAHGRQLAVLPDAHALEEAEHIALLLLPQLFDVLVSLR